MSDPFSTGASAITFISLAVQLVDSVNKLCEFWGKSTIAYSFNVAWSSQDCQYVSNIGIDKSEASLIACRSVQKAPEDIAALTDDLRFISNLLQKIRGDVQGDTVDSTYLQALQRCESIVASMNAMVEDLAPGFASSSCAARKRTALKGVKRGRED